MADIQSVRFEPNETPPTPLAVGLAFQLVILTISGIVLTPTIVITAGNGPADFLIWGIFAALVVSGLCTMLQAVRWHWFGSGHVLLMGTSGAFIAVCVTALSVGGAAMLCTLVLVSSLVQFGLARNLAMVRRIITPTVAGVVIMLIPVTVFPIIFDMLSDVQPEHTNYAPIVAGATILIGAGLSMRATGMLRLWTPLIGLLSGTLIAVMLGMFDMSQIASAAWVGFPSLAWPGLDLSFGPLFWSLLPAFVFVTVVGMVETIGDAVAIQRVSQRSVRAADFRVVQGAVGTDGVGNLLSGLIGTVPNTTYSTSVAVTELTGVASRRVGVFAGIILLLFAFLPKLQAVIMSLPAPVAGGYLSILLAMLFVVGMKLVVRDGLDFRKAVIVGVSLWIGAGFQFNLIFPDMLTGGGAIATILQNGMTVGGFVAIFLTVLWELTSSRRKRLVTTLQVDKLDDLREFITQTASGWKWKASSIDRVVQVNEELILTLIEDAKQDDSDEPRTLRVSAKHDSGAIQLEYLAATGEENIEDRALVMQEAASSEQAPDLSLRLLHHLASEVRHQQYLNLDVVNVRVERVAPTG